MPEVLPDRTPAEMKRVEQVANRLLGLLHFEWDEESEAAGQFHPADFIEAAIAATASIAAQHVHPEANLGRVIEDHTDLFREALSGELFAAIRARRSS